MNKTLKLTAGAMMAAALMVGCNVNDGVPDNNESMMDNNRVNDVQNDMDNNAGERGDGYNNMGRDNNGTNGNNDIIDNNDNNREDVIEDDIDREDRDNRDE
ncbi:hypothetical protein [Jeotgalibacillus aurantiacus]|uniref:hypothetical protein n=1 Tax=Jeotgalibacillus aurantiacus TaxID=2763266 RepID=UPI001D09D763|nr:hypothetical protein [Jeotgalibacillus aurantiacus]